MRYPIMTEQQLAERWSVSVKTQRRWREHKIGPKWWKLSRHVRYHEEDVIAFEAASTQHLNRVLGRDESNALIAFTPADADDNAQPDEKKLLKAQEVANITHLPLHLFTDRSERDRTRIPCLNLVGVLRFDLAAILQWELENSRLGVPELPAPAVVEAEPSPPERVPRWHEVVRKQGNGHFDSLQSSD